MAALSERRGSTGEEELIRRWPCRRISRAPPPPPRKFNSAVRNEEVYPTTKTLAGGSDAGDHMRRGKANRRGGEERAQREEAVGRLGDAGGCRNQAGSVGGCGSEEWSWERERRAKEGSPEVGGERDGWVVALPKVGGEGEAIGR